MARLSDADQGGLPVPRLDFGSPDCAGPDFVPGSRTAQRGIAGPRYPGVAELLLQVSDDRAGAVSGARFVHSAYEVEEHAAPPEGRRVDYSLRAGVLRLRSL